MLPSHRPDGSCPRWFAFYMAAKYLWRNPGDYTRTKKVYSLWRRPLLTEIFKGDGTLKP